MKETKKDLTLDWQQIRHRLEATQAITEKGFEPTLEEKKRILKERAKALARKPEVEASAERSIEIVEFQLAYERYALEMEYIREAYPLKELTPLPCTPSFVLGVVNVRGQILSVIDIKKFFDLPEKGITNLNKIIILHSDEMEFAILADAIIGVKLILLKDIQPSLPTLTDVRTEYLKGVTTERLVILDAAKILSDERIIVNEEI